MTNDEQTRWGVVLLRVVAALVVIVGGYVALALWQGDRIGSDTTVAGVDVSGLSRDDARAKVASQAGAIERKPITVELGDEGRTTLVPAASGLRLDVEASLAGLGGQSFLPTEVLGKLTGAEQKPAVVRADRAALSEALHKAAGAVLTGAPKDGSVSIEGGQVEVVRSTPGQGIDADAVAAQIATRWPATSQFSAPVALRQPRLANTEIDRFVREFATPATDDGLTVSTGTRSAQLSPRQIGELTTIKQTGRKLSATIDGDKAATLLIEQDGDLEMLPTNAKVALAAGKPATVTPAKNGSVIDRAKLGPALVAALAADQSTVKAPMKAAKPSVSTTEARQVGAMPAITEFKSKFPGGAGNRIRTQNMRVALAAMNGTVVGKGEQFSLIRTLGGELTPDKGYGAAPTIQGGKERAAQGGGVSQVSTALYNAAFFAGVQLDEHKPHSFWIERYPAGREATLWVPKFDNKWTNDTNKPIVIQAGIVGDEVIVRFLGQRKYTVETTSSEKYNIRQPQTIEDDHPGCLPVPTNIGFDIDVTRTLKLGGKVVRTERSTTKYNAANRVICTNV